MSGCRWRILKSAKAQISRSPARTLNINQATVVCFPNDLKLFCLFVALSLAWFTFAQRTPRGHQSRFQVSIRSPRPVTKMTLGYDRRRDDGNKYRDKTFTNAANELITVSFSPDADFGRSRWRRPVEQLVSDRRARRPSSFRQFHRVARNAGHRRPDSDDDYGTCARSPLVADLPQPLGRTGRRHARTDDVF